MEITLEKCVETHTKIILNLQNTIMQLLIVDHGKNGIQIDRLNSKTDYNN